MCSAIEHITFCPSMTRLVKHRLVPLRFTALIRSCLARTKMHQFFSLLPLVESRRRTSSAAAAAESSTQTRYKHGQLLLQIFYLQHQRSDTKSSSSGLCHAMLWLASHAGVCVFCAEALNQGENVDLDALMADLCTIEQELGSVNAKPNSAGCMARLGLTDTKVHCTLTNQTHFLTFYFPAVWIIDLKSH